MTNNQTLTNQNATTNMTLGIFEPHLWAQMEKVAQTFINSRAMPSYITNPAQLMLIFSHGAQMGMSPTEAVSSLYLVNGMVNIWGKAAVARLTREGYRLTYKEGDCDNDNAWCEVTVERGEERYTQLYTFDMAKKSIKLTDKYNHYKPGWIPGQNRLLKLRYGAINIILKTYLPHLLYSCNGLAEIDAEAITGQSFNDGKVTSSSPTTKLSPKDNSTPVAPAKPLPALTSVAYPKIWEAAVEKLSKGETTLDIIQSHYTLTPTALGKLQEEVAAYTLAHSEVVSSEKQVAQPEENKSKQQQVEDDKQAQLEQETSY